MSELKPAGELKTKLIALRMKEDELKKLDSLCEAAQRERSTLMRFLINDAYYRAVKKGAIATDETEAR